MMCRGLHRHHSTHCLQMQDCDREQQGSLCQQSGMEATCHDQTESQPQRLLPERGRNNAICNIRWAVSVFGRSMQVTGITLSKEQLAEAKLRVKQAGLDDRIKLLFCDYR